MKSENKIGPNTDTSGTPDTTSKSSDKQLSTQTHCVR